MSLSHSVSCKTRILLVEQVDYRFRKISAVLSTLVLSVKFVSDTYSIRRIPLPDDALLQLCSEYPSSSSLDER